MRLTNPWVGYLQRNYTNIKNAILSRIRILVPEITDFSDSNILVIMASSFAGLIEQLNYYIDLTARELYINTARRFSSVIKITRLIDYRVKANIASFVDLRVTLVDDQGEPLGSNTDLVIPRGTRIKTPEGLEFITSRSKTIETGGSSVLIPARQRVLVSTEQIGITNNEVNQPIPLPLSYDDNTLSISINGEDYELKDTFGFSGPLDKHCIVRVDETGTLYVVFGDGVNGVIPPRGYAVLATYYECQGSNGNVSPNSITVWGTNKPNVVGTGADDILVTNPTRSVGGQDIQSTPSIRRKAPLSLRTLDRAVTLKDHEELACLVNGVKAALPVFNQTNKVLDIFIAAETRGVPPQALLDDLDSFFEDRKLIGTSVVFKPTGETLINLDLSIKLRAGMNADKSISDIKRALVDEYGYNNSYINRPLRKSDIIALIDNQQPVDYLHLDSINTTPYPHKVYGNNELYVNFRIETLGGSTSKVKWELYMISSTSVRLFRDGIFMGNFSNIPATDPGGWLFSNSQVRLQMWGVYDVGDSWAFFTYPTSTDIVLDDNTIPVVSSDIININLL